MKSLCLNTEHQKILAAFLRPYYKAKRPKRLAKGEMWDLFLKCLLSADHQEVNNFHGDLPSIRDIENATSYSQIESMLPSSRKNIRAAFSSEKKQIASFLKNPNVIRDHKFVLPAELRKFLPENKKLEEQQNVRKKLVKLAVGALDWERASIFLAKSQICMDLLTNYIDMCNKLSLLGIPVSSWNNEQEDNWIALENSLFPLARGFHIRLSQVSDILVGEAPEKLQQNLRANELSHEEIDRLVEAAKQEEPGIGEAQNRLWNYFKDDVKKHYRRVKARLAEVCLDYDDFESVARSPSEY